MILHITEDEKFIDRMIELFEEANPNHNLYLVNVPESNYKTKFIKYAGTNIKFLPYSSKEYQEVIKDRHSFKAVIFHNLYSSYKWDLIHRLDSRIKKHWKIWGAELYINNTFFPQLFLPETLKHLKRINYLSYQKYRLERNNPHIWNFMHYLFGRRQNSYYRFLASVKKIDSISPIVTTEIPIFEKYFKMQIPQFQMQYTYFEKLIEGFENEVCNEGNILVANSGTSTNNHFDSLKVLEENISDNRKIILPLSYGVAKYIAYLKEFGLNKYGENFISLDKFVSLNKYKNIVKSCGYVLNSSLRQQGMENILLALVMGAKVYLIKSNPIYAYLSSIGIKHYNIEELNMTNDDISNSDLAFYNRGILKKIYGKEKVLNEIDTLVKYLMCK